MQYIKNIKKYNLRDVFYKYPIEIWNMWTLLILTTLAILIKIYLNLTDKSNIYKYILKL